MASVHGVHHIGLTVSDADRSSAFYQQYFNLREIGRWPLAGEKISRAVGLPGTDLTAVLLAAADERAVVELIEYREPDGRPYGLRNSDIGAAHVCFFVDDLNELVARLTADGVKLNAPVQELVDGTPMVYLEDPDGINVEVLQPGPGLTLSDLFGYAEA